MQKIQDKKTNPMDEVKQIYESGKYFSDAYDWYCDRFLAPYSERVFLFFLSIFSLLIVIIVTTIIVGLFPLKETFPVLVQQEDSFLYTPVIKKLKPENIDYTSNESVARYLAMNYIKLLFDNNFSNNDLNILRNKLEKIQNLSTKSVYERARTYLNELFKNNSNQRIEIREIRFVNNSKDIYNYSKENYRIEFDCKLYKFKENNTEDNKLKILLTFKFNNINYSEKTGSFEPIKFTVNDFVIKN